MIEQLENLSTDAEYPRAGQATAFFQKYSLLVYFFFAFLISWVLWFIEPGLRSK